MPNWKSTWGLSISKARISIALEFPAFTFSWSSRGFENCRSIHPNGNTTSSLLSLPVHLSQSFFVPILFYIEIGMHSSLLQFILFACLVVIRSPMFRFWAFITCHEVISDDPLAWFGHQLVRFPVLVCSHYNVNGIHRFLWCTDWKTGIRWLCCFEYNTCTRVGARASVSHNKSCSKKMNRYLDVQLPHAFFSFDFEVYLFFSSTVEYPKEHIL